MANKLQCVGVVFLLLLFSCRLWAEGTEKKLPVPEPAALADATKLINDVYKADFPAAKTPSQKYTLIRKLLATAKDENGASRYALLITARDTAVDAADVEGCANALDAIVASFDVDPLKFRLDSYNALARSLHSPDDRDKLADLLTAIVRTAIAEDRFDVARTAADAGLNNARATNNPTLTKAATTDVQTVRDAEAAFADVKKSLAVLAEKPSDPDANLKVGKYVCFVKGDWDRGLPMLALSEDAVLKPLAAKELAGGTEPEKLVALGDGWWDAAEKEPGPTKPPFQKRAAKWYNQALPDLVGLQKAKVELRLKTLPEIKPVRLVNLLKLVDIERDAVRGKWELQNGMLACDAAAPASLEFRYQPPEEYDYKVVFTRKDAKDCTVQVCRGGGRQFALQMGGFGNTVYAFDVVAGKRGDNNQTTRRAKLWLEDGRQYTSVVKVRKDHVQAYLDGKLITEWKTDYRDMRLHFHSSLHRITTIGVGSFSSPTLFQKAEVQEITGTGQLLRTPGQRATGLDAKDPLPEPPSLLAYKERTGQSLYFNVTGRTTGTVWGSGPYTNDSDLATAAVHAGAIKEGESAIVKVNLIGNENAYKGSTQNGVVTSDWGPFKNGSFQIEKVK